MMALCCNPPKCDKCWKKGHIGSHCRYMKLNPAAPPYNPKEAKCTSPREEPLFDDLLVGPKPDASPLMPANNPTNFRCFAERVENYFIETKRMQRLS
jgi:hypothetical protein